MFILSLLGLRLTMDQLKNFAGQEMLGPPFPWVRRVFLHCSRYLFQRDKGQELEIAFHVGIRGTQKQLLKLSVII